ncbi:hypothetical protein BHM03_00035244 [Ensete ventricosum]|nr:hypothetical protein BHM03_00035244 [Ensete ventricosum]
MPQLRHSPRGCRASPRALRCALVSPQLVSLSQDRIRNHPIRVGFRSRQHEISFTYKKGGKKEMGITRYLHLFHSGRRRTKRETKNQEEKKRTHCRNHRKIGVDPPSATLRQAGTPAFRLLFPVVVGIPRAQALRPSSSATRTEPLGVGIGIIEIRTASLKDSLVDDAIVI